VVRASAPDDSEPRRFPRLLDKLKGRTAAQAQAAPRRAQPVEQPLELPATASGVPPAAIATAPPGGGGAGPASTANGVPQEPLEPIDADANSAGLESSSNSAPSAAWQIHETANFRIFHHDARLAESAGAKAEAVRTAQGHKLGSQAAAKRWVPACEIYLYSD